MKDITIFDKTYLKENTENYRLSIQLSLDGFSFTTLDTISGKFNSFYYESLNDGIDMDDYLSSIENFLEKDFFAEQYKDISIVLESPQSTLIPSVVFEKEKLKQIFEFNHTLPDDNALNYNKIRNSEIYCIFSIPSFIATLLINKFKRYNMYHQSTPLIEDALMKSSEFVTTHKVFVNVSKTLFDILVCSENGEVKLFNSYETKSPTDVVYFIVNCFEQLKLDRKETPLLLTGIYDLKSEIVSQLERFISNVEHESLKRQNYEFEPIFKKIPVSRFPNLFKILKCE